MFEVKSYDDYFDRLLTRIDWSSISSFGDTHFAKAFLLAPVIAQAVKYSSEFFEFNLGLNNMAALYWSLIYLAIGQGLYLYGCPREIKKYRNDIEKFKIENVSTLTISQLDSKFNQSMRSYFKAGGGSAEIPYLDLDSFKKRMQTAHDKIDNDIYPYQPYYETTTEKQHYQVYLGLHGRLSGRNSIMSEVNWPLALLLNGIVPFGQHADENIRKDVQMKMHQLISERTDDSWKYATLERSHNALNQSRPTIRAYSALFYFSGTIYFIYYAALHLIRMFQYSLQMMGYS